MKVQIIKPFSVDGRGGDVSYTQGQITENGKQSWINKGLAVAVKGAPKAAPIKKSAD